jgi:hypothetical protein
LASLEAINPQERLWRTKFWYMTTNGPPIMWWKNLQILLRILAIC